MSNRNKSLKTIEKILIKSCGVKVQVRLLFRSFFRKKKIFSYLTGVIRDLSFIFYISCLVVILNCHPTIPAIKRLAGVALEVDLSECITRIYRLGTVNSNTVNPKFQLYQTFFL